MPPPGHPRSQAVPLSKLMPAVPPVPQAETHPAPTCWALTCLCRQAEGSWHGPQGWQEPRPLSSGTISCSSHLFLPPESQSISPREAKEASPWVGAPSHPRPILISTWHRGPLPPHSGPFQLVPPEAKKEPLCGALAPSPFASLLYSRPPPTPADEVPAPSSS